MEANDDPEYRQAPAWRTRPGDAAGIAHVVISDLLILY
jgi:hypothetical protein